MVFELIEAAKAGSIDTTIAVVAVVVTVVEWEASPRKETPDN